MTRKSFNLAGLCLLTFALAACKPKELNELTDAASALKKVFAAETAQVAGANKQIVLVVPKATKGPSANLGEEFKSALAKEGLSVVEIQAADLGDAMHYVDFGWKAADFLEAIQKHPAVGAIVSLVGVPKLNNLGQVPATHPPILVIATAQIGMAPGVRANPDVLAQLLDAKIIQLAVVDSEGAPSGKTDKTSKVFSQHFQILRGAR